MKIPILSTACLLLFCAQVLRAQHKPVLTESDIKDWSRLGRNFSLGTDGKYALYFIEKPGFRNNQAILQATDGSWKKTINDISQFNATLGKAKAYFLRNDSLLIISLGTQKQQVLQGVSGFTLIRQGHDEIVYQSSDKQGGMKYIGAKKNNYRTFPGAKMLTFSSAAGTFAYQVTGITEQENRLHIYDSRTGSDREISTANAFTSVQFDSEGRMLAYIKKSKGLQQEHTSVCVAGISSVTENRVITIAESDTLEIKSILGFSKTSGSLFFIMKQKSASPVKITGTSVDVWSYQDAKLQSAQLADLGHESSYPCGVNLKTGLITRLQWPNEETTIGINPSDAVLVSHYQNLPTSEFWNQKSRREYLLLSVLSGKRVSVLRQTSLSNVQLSPSGRFVAYYEPGKLAFYAYDVSSNKTIKLISTESRHWNAYSVIYWSEDERVILVFDRSDLWALDPTGIIKPKNLTHSANPRGELTFSFANAMNGRTIDLSRPVLLSAFHRSTKDNGFYELVASRGSVKKLTMGPYLYYAPANSGSEGISPSGAPALGYLVARMDASTAQNLFYTTDWKNFRQLSNIAPEKKVNWYFTQLHNFYDNGQLRQGILYLPEDFDPAKKYPLIFHYYEQKSHLLNEYLQPDLSEGNMNIPWFVSRGYLVFTPDMYNKPDHVAESITSTVRSAIDHLAKLNYIDTAKLGLQGFSYGGYQTNLLVTRLPGIKAAVAGAGVSDAVSQYAHFSDAGNNAQQYNQHNLQKIPAEDPWTYVANSAIFNATKVQAPMLLMNNKNDDSVRWTQGLEFFIALRRLGKRVWMLQYDHGAHGVFDNDAWDYTIRMTQFFDHYLKGKPAPVWMLKGIPASRKGIDYGLELSPEKGPDGKPLTPISDTIQNK